MHGGRWTLTKYLSDGETHAAINSKMIKKLHTVSNSEREVELVKAYIENKEAVIAGFSFRQFAKVRILEVYYVFFTNFYDVNKFEELEMDKDSLYLAVAEKELEYCIQPEIKTEWKRL